MYAQAGNIQVNISTCDSFTLTGNAGNQTLNCVISNAPTGCQIQGPTTGTNGNAITLTAVCATGSPTTYAWSGGNCQGNTTQSCQANGSNATVNYSVVISNAIGAGTPNPATKSVLWSNALPVPPSNCTITPSPTSLPAGGGAVSLTARCAGGDAVDTWSWTNVTTSSGNTATASPTVSTTFGVTATNGGGSGTGSVTVNVGSSSNGPISCSGFLNTNSKSATWPNWFANAQLTMGTLDAAVYQFTTPATGNTNTGQVMLYTGSGQDSKHDAFVSLTPCDFSNDVLQGGIYFTIGQSVPGIPTLQTGKTYYINVRNSVGALCLSGATSCNVSLNLNKPGGIR